MANILQTSPGHFWIGDNEEKTITVDVSNWLATPAAACAVVLVGASDVSACVFQSAASAGATISSGCITTPCFVNLVAGCSYRCELRFEQGGEALKCFFNVTGAS